jgi:hypothetical protein
LQGVLARPSRFKSQVGCTFAALMVACAHATNGGATFSVLRRRITRS